MQIVIMHLDYENLLKVMEVSLNNHNYFHLSWETLTTVMSQELTATHYLLFANVLLAGSYISLPNILPNPVIIIWFIIVVKGNNQTKKSLKNSLKTSIYREKS